MTAALEHLTHWYGISSGYHDIWGNYIETPESTKFKVLQSLGCDVSDAASADKALKNCHYNQWHRLLNPVQIHPENKAALVVEIRLPKQESARTINWKVILENQSVESGQFIQADLTWQKNETITNPDSNEEQVIDFYTWTLPASIPTGYHLLELFDAESKETLAGEMALIVTPAACYLPENYSKPKEQAKRQWGPAVQLYSLRSKTNWGMGDFSDLKKLVQWSGKEEAGVIGVNPLHELFPHQPLHKSPYSPSSRGFFNTLYIDLTVLPEFKASKEAQALFNDPKFQDKLAAAKDAEYVNYQAVADLKRPVMEAVYQTFKTEEILTGTERAATFEEFVKKGGTALKHFTVFQTLHEYFVRKDMNLWRWDSWPAEYQNPANKAIEDFAVEHADRVQYFQYLQWLAYEQLTAIKAETKKAGLETGLYLDLAVGSDISGADVWLNQNLYALTMSVGAPPDECNQKGQNWGLPPYHPSKIKDVAYIPFIRMLRQNMRHAGALRIDHVMGLMRLFWIPEGEDATTGAYVHYDFDDFLGLLALESHRNQCVIIGEDLGTVQEEVQQKMAQWQVLSYKLLFFERQDLGVFKQPEEYPKLSLCALTTHDLPTLLGFWTKEDIKVRTELDLYPNDDFKTTQENNRTPEKLGMLRALEHQGLLPDSFKGYDENNIPELNGDLVNAIHQYLYRCESYLSVFQLEEVFNQPKQVNLPGTVEQYPNWERKITVDIEDWPIQREMQNLLASVKNTTQTNEKTLASV